MAFTCRRALLSLLALGAVSACDAPDSDPGISPSVSVPAPSRDNPIPSGDKSGGPGRNGPGEPEQVAQDIDVPWGVAFLPGGDALIAERDTARIVRVPARGGGAKQVYEVPGVAAAGEGGLLGLAVSPDYATDNLVYAYYTAAADNRIARFRLDGGEPEVIFDGIAKAGNHNGGRIAFGPDGLLYAGTGDAGDTSRAQDPSSPNGKILRLTPDGAPAPGNPSPGSPVYSLGHRNVQGLAWDGDGRLFATEFGQNELDEVNLIRAGRNYGWPEVEGEGDTGGGRYTNPVVTWPTDEASPSGIAIAGDTAYVAALRGERLWTLALNGDTVGEPVARFEGRYGRLRTVQVAPDGSLWVTTSNKDGRGDVRDGDDRVLRIPVK
ncbi:PQQ-dependent sugar dehydrogenase [Winogradskya consettensis]|uniref:Oxidoreductase n=1 Tax=Winogradskya consettensis TaxID=113560 RepID=A0A919T453_9ACTN|nr:PQQ-dependent sugar dehydrogenase [Actinoplanes consettensis]GIM84235.1 oxidoreductase [Actinoplanes consettensis]